MSTIQAGISAHIAWEAERNNENECAAESRIRSETQHSQDWWLGWLERSDAWRDEIGHDALLDSNPPR